MKFILKLTIVALAAVGHLAAAQTLNNGQAISVGGNTGSTSYYSIQVPSNAKDLVIRTANGSGDVDLYVRHNAQPTTSNYSCRPYQWGNDESCSFSSPSSGTYYIMLYGYSSYSNVSLLASYTGGASQTPTPVPSSPPNGADEFDIVTYNAEWLGNPAKSGYNGSRTQQIQTAANDILNGGGEIYALQEVGGSAALNDLLYYLNAYDNSDSWSGNVSQPSATQSLAFVYKNSVVTGAGFQTILTNESNYDFAGRYPYLMTANIYVGGVSRSLRIINLHLKCCTGSANATRRADAMATLVSNLHSSYRNDNVIILGDLNVAQEGGAIGEISDWGFYADRDGDGRADYSHAAGSVEDKPYNSNDTKTDIDHILISNEVRTAWDAVSSSKRNQYLNTSYSDHSPVKTTLKASLIGQNSTPPTPPPSGAISVSQALAQSVGTSVTVSGVIQAAFNGSYALVLRDSSNSSKTIVVKLETNQRLQWSPELNPSVIGQTIQVVGRRDSYSGQASIEYVSNISN